MSGQQRELTMRFLAEPTDVNYGGKVHGGEVMKWIDQAGYAAAVGWSGVQRDRRGGRDPLRGADPDQRPGHRGNHPGPHRHQLDAFRGGRARARSDAGRRRAPVHPLRDRVRRAGRGGRQAGRGAGAGRRATRKTIAWRNTRRR